MKAKYQQIVKDLKEAMLIVDENSWQMPWDNNFQSPINAKTQHRYISTNRILLGFDALMRGQDAIYATFKQWQDIGCNVRKGAKSNFIIVPVTIKKKGLT